VNDENHPTGPSNPAAALLCTGPLAGSWFSSRHEDHVTQLLSKFCGEIVEEEAEGEEIVDASDEIQATGAATALFPMIGFEPRSS
jgi:hypothetical protein